MQEKQKATKVTLYLPNDLHRKLKIRSASDGEAMSAIAERAIVFYLEHAEIVDGLERLYGHTHQVYSCPACTTSLVVKGDELATISNSVIVDSSDELGVDVQEFVSDAQVSDTQVSAEEGELVPC